MENDTPKMTPKMSPKESNMSPKMSPRIDQYGYDGTIICVWRYDHMMLMGGQNDSPITWV